MDIKVIQELLTNIEMSGPLLLVLWSGISLALISLFKDSRYLSFLTWTIPCGSVLLLLPDYQEEIINTYKALTAIYIGAMLFCFLRNILGSIARVGFQLISLELLTRFFFSMSLRDFAKDYTNWASIAKSGMSSNANFNVTFPDAYLKSTKNKVNKQKNKVNKKKNKVNKDQPIED